MDALGGNLGKENRLSIARVLFILALSELIFLGPGWTLTTYNMSIREVIFLLNFCVFFAVLFLRGRFLFPSLSRISVVFAFLNVVVWGLLVALARDNTLNYALADSKGFLYLLYVLPWTNFAFYENWSNHFAVNVFLILVSLFSIVVNLIVILFRFDSLRFYQIISFLDNTLNFHVIFGLMPDGFPRIVWAQFIFLIPASLFLTSELISRKSLSFLKSLALLSCFLSLVFSYSRGLWLGLIVGLIFLFPISTRHLSAKRILIVASVVLCCFVIIALFGLSYSTLIQERFISSFDIREMSNAIRFSQAKPLILEWMKYPFLGKGYGATVEGLIRSDVAPYSFELVPLALLMKLGLVGIALWISYFILLMSESKRRIENAKYKGNIEQGWMFRAIYASIPAVLVASSGDPFFFNSVGMGMMAFWILMLTINGTEISHERC